jgi:hypothetical protein
MSANLNAQNRYCIDEYLWTREDWLAEVKACQEALACERAKPTLNQTVTNVLSARIEAAGKQWRLMYSRECEALENRMSDVAELRRVAPLRLVRSDSLMFKNVDPLARRLA